MFRETNIKKIVQYLLVIMCIGFGAGFLILFSTGGISEIFHPDPANSQKISEERLEKVTGIEEVEIEASSVDMNVVPADTGEVRAVLKGKFSNMRKPELQMYTEGSKLHIKVKITNGNKLLSSNANLVLNVQIPSSYANNLKIVSKSGDVTLERLKLKNLDFDLSSGDAIFADLNIDQFKYDSSSGGLNGDNIITRNTVLHISSGNIVIRKFEGDLKADTSSGDINVQYQAFKNNANIEVSSGDVVLSLPGNSEFRLNAHASSGNIECKFPIIVTGEYKQNELQGTVGKDNNKINVETNSGDIRIIK
ncbi:MAG: DUF4097 family beta strand repeat-containing protein [Syntrophomonas sp.]